MRSRREIETMAIEIIVLREHDIAWKLIQRRFASNRSYLWRAIKRYKSKILIEFERQHLGPRHQKLLASKLGHDGPDDAQLDLFDRAEHARNGSR